MRSAVHVPTQMICYLQITASCYLVKQFYERIRKYVQINNQIYRSSLMYRNMFVRKGLYGMKNNYFPNSKFVNPARSKNLTPDAAPTKQ